MNMWKTVALRMTQAKSEIEKMGEDTDGMLESTAKYRDLIKASTGFDILEEDQKTLKSTYEIILNIGKAWDSLNDLDRNALLYALAGTRQSNALAAALTNIEDMEAAYQAAENSAGSAQAEQEKYTKSIQYSLDVFKATKEELANNLYDSQGLKDSVDVATKFLEIINKLVKSVGTLGTALTAVMTYKGFKSGFGGTGLLGYLNNTRTGFKNFFTQRQLSDDALTLGITHDDVKMLTDYDKLLKATTQDTTAMATTMSRMSPAAKTFATDMQAGAASVESLTVATQAAQVGMKLLHATLSMGATLLISYGITQFIKKMDELIVTEEEAKQQHDELIASINSNIDKRNAEQKEIQALIKEYQSYGELTSYTAEQKEQLKNIQDQLIDTYGLEADGIDLVNGKYEEQIKLLDEKARKKAKENNANLWTAYEETKSDYDNNSGYSFKQIFNANSIGTKGKGLFATDVYEESALKKAFSDVFEETTKITGLHYNNMEKTSSIQTQEITFALRTVDEDGNPLDANAMLEQVLAIQDRIDEIRRDSSQQSLTQSQEFIDLQAQVAKWTEHYQNEVDANNAALTDLAKNIALTTAVNIDGVDYYADTVTSDIYNEYKEKLVEAYSESEPEVADAITKYLDDTYGKAFAEEVKNVKKSISELYSETYSAIKKEKVPVLTLFEAEAYKDKTKEVSQSFSELEEAIKAIDDGGLPDPELLVKFPELSAYTDDVNVLRQAILNLMTDVPNDLIDELSHLKENIDLSVDTLKSALTELGEGGAVDLTNRAVIDTKLLKDAGWDEIEEGIATLYTSTYTNGQSGKKAVAINFTPIVVDENGKYVGVLSPDELDEYAEGVINKTRADDLHLQIGAEFTGKNAEKEASATAEYIHELQEYLYSYSANELTKEEEKQKGLIQGFITLLEKLTGKVKKLNGELTNVSASDYIKYDEANIQKIIDKLEKEKDTQDDILDSLKAQKEELENIISQYKQVVDVVTDYIDKSQIKPLEQRKSDVEEYYNAQIEALKAENEERDRNIELQKAQDALANARKTKVRMYNETQGWHTEFDTNAIKNAENELSSLQNEIAIDNLEKQRDSEVKGIEEQIEAWENYKEQWKEQVEQITKADEELTASKILGADWHEKIANQDIDVMVNFGSQYQSYNNRLHNQVDVEISNIEKAIKSRENEIAEWKDYKTQLSDINTSITESNDTYLQTLNQFVIDENSTWEQRIKHMRRNAQIIAELNRQASEVPEIDAESALTGSKLWGIARDGNVLKLYASESEAKADKENIVKDLVRKQIAPGMPSDVIETITKRIMESLEIKQYARGGINTNTGLAWLDGTNSNSEVVFNSAQAKQLYDIVRNGNYGEMISKNILNNINNQSALSARENANRSQAAQSINISFPNATINAKDYDSFKGFMDRYTNDLLLKMQVGL